MRSLLSCRMRLLFVLALASAAAALDLGSPVEYAPQVNVSCLNTTSTPLVRVFTPETQSLNPLEAEYIATREATVIADAWKQWLGNGSDSALGYNLSVFNAVNFSKVGIAVSGGGYRAAQYGAGVLSGLDARNESAVSAGTGGLLQVTSYLSGLSGGSWLVGSLFFNDWPKIPDMIFGNGGNLSGWILDLNLATPDGDNLFDEDNQYFFGSLLWSVVAKADKGIDTSLTDPWARMISYHFLNGTSRNNFFTNDSAHGAGQLWSRIPELPSFQQHLTPFPLIVANSRPVGSNLTTILSPEPIVYEITPAEFGSWDPNLSAMVNITYIGTNFNNGTPPNSTGCVTGFDEAGFMMGTSASLFNQVLDFVHNKLQGFSSNDASSLLYVLSRQLTEVRTRANDVANWPNPFQSLKPDTFEDSNSKWLELIDGSSNEEDIPLGALFVKSRALDVIVAVDASADDPTFGWPNGSSLIFSSQRMSNILNTSHQSFPPIPPSTAEFLSSGVNQRPTFFGCDPTQTPPEYPLLIYLPNTPPINGDDPVTNTGTFQIQYSGKFSTVFLNQAHNSTILGFTPKSIDPDTSFGGCLQCAAIDRARYKISPTVPRSAFCTTCFMRYCFDPQSPPSSTDIVGRKYAFVDPDPQGLSRVEDFFKAHKVAIILGVIALVAVIVAAVFFLRWWTARRNRKYKRLTLQAEETDAPWKAYSDRLGSFELPARRANDD
ncbi:phospholipase B [Phellopilus nigrolimitatus]|nr:phospholipase B [Phellopilus nigrolimitatus]